MIFLKGFFTCCVTFLIVTTSSLSALKVEWLDDIENINEETLKKCAIRAFHLLDDKHIMEPEKKYKLVARDLLGRKVTVGKVMVNEDHYIYSAGYEEKTPAFLFIAGIFLGDIWSYEIKRWFKSVDEVSFCPIPFKSPEREGHQIQVTLIDPVSWTYKIDLIGFEEGEKLKMVSLSGKEILTKVFDYSSNTIHLILPATIDAKEGISVLSFYKESDPDFEPLSIRYMWGALPMANGNFKES